MPMGMSRGFGANVGATILPANSDERIRRMTMRNERLALAIEGLERRPDRKALADKIKALKDEMAANEAALAETGPKKGRG